MDGHHVERQFFAKPKNRTGHSRLRSCKSGAKTIAGHVVAVGAISVLTRVEFERMTSSCQTIYLKMKISIHYC